MQTFINFFRSNTFVYGVFAIAITAVMVFAVAPQLPQVASTIEKATVAAGSVYAFGESNDGGCCGGGDGAGIDWGGDSPSEEPKQKTPRCDFLTASTNKVPHNGGNVTLRWETTNAKYVSIDNGIGRVSEDGSKTVFVDSKTTFTLTATRDSQQDTCTVTIKVEEEEKVAKCDYLTANRTSVPHNGANVTLSWGTTNATSVSINNGIGNVQDDGSRTVFVNGNTTYTLTAVGTGGNDTCTVTITKEQEKVAKCDYLSSNRTTVPYGGGNVTLSWGTTNATSVSINNGVGSVSDDGSRTVYVNDTTTFTLTAYGTDGNDTCSVTIYEDNDEDEIPRCDYLTISDDDVEEGDEVTLRWETTNADYVYINNGIGGVSRDGSKNVRVYDDTTYVLTAEGDGRKDTCSVRVEVEEEEDEEPRPRCELTVSDKKVKVGEKVTLRWETRDAEEVEIEDNRGNTIFRDRNVSRNDDGRVSVTITRDTKFTLNAEGDGGDRTCKVEVEVEDSNILVLTDREQPRVAGISLTQVPYTGFEAGPTLTFLFYALLTLWAAAVAYMLVIRKDTILGFSLARENGRIIHEEVPGVTYQASAATAPANLPVAAAPVMGYAAYEPQVAEDDTETEESDELAALENYAHDRRVLLSSDALRYVYEHMVPEGGIEALDQLVNDAKAAYPTEDGWLVLNIARIEQLLGDEEATPVVSIPTPTTDTLAQAIVRGDVIAAYRMIEARPMVALAQAAAELDQAYRAKVTGGEVALAFAGHSDESLKAAVTALTSALDGTYTDEQSAVKIAIMKAIQACTA